MFDVDKFMSSKQEGNLSTEYVNVPEDEYPAAIHQVDKPTSFKTDDGNLLWSFQVHWNISDERAKKATGRDRNIVRQRIGLDLDEKGKLDTQEGRNVKLGQLLKAVGLHGKPWSADDLVGRTAMVRVTHTPNKKDPGGQPYSNVSTVAAL